jgi:hypothetical protein
MHADPGIIGSLDTASALIYSALSSLLHACICVQLDASSSSLFLYAIHMHVRLPKAETARFAGAGDIPADRIFISGLGGFSL